MSDKDLKQKLEEAINKVRVNILAPTLISQQSIYEVRDECEKIAKEYAEEQKQKEAIKFAVWFKYTNISTKSLNNKEIYQLFLKQ